MEEILDIPEKELIRKIMLESRETFANIKRQMLEGCVSDKTQEFCGLISISIRNAAKQGLEETCIIVVNDAHSLEKHLEFKFSSTDANEEIDEMAISDLYTYLMSWQNTFSESEELSTDGKLVCDLIAAKNIKEILVKKDYLVEFENRTEPHTDPEYFLLIKIKW